MRSPRSVLALTLAVAAAVAVGTATAAANKLPKQVRKAFRGKILFSNEALPAPDATDGAGTVKTYRKESVKFITHADDGGVPTWRFHFMALMKRKPTSTMVSLDFYDKDNRFVAQERLAGIDPRLVLLSSKVTLSEDDGLSVGGVYKVKLTSKKGKKEVVLATGKLVAK